MPHRLGQIARKNFLAKFLVMHEKNRNLWGEEFFLKFQLFGLPMQL